MQNEFVQLQKLGFTTANGLVHNLDEALNNAERLYIEEAKKLGTDAVFFRRKYVENSDENIPFDSTPTVCVFQKPSNFFNSKDHKKLHAALWSAGKTEIYVIQADNRIDIINARKPAKRTGDNDVTIEDADLNLIPIGTALKSFNDERFSAHLFGSGTFWEQSEFQEKIDGNSSPYVFLLDYLMQIRKLLSSTKRKKNKATSKQIEFALEPVQKLDLSAVTIDKLLITSILIKFLEEIKDDNGKHTLQVIYKKHKIKSFDKALEKGISVDVLGDLANEFNGKIFDTFTKDERKKISATNLNSIAQFLRADVDLTTQQLFIWKQYSFKHLPAEVISAIYENFIQAESSRTGVIDKGVVYTPIHLVNMLIDEVMPLHRPELFKKGLFRVLDPACGSGVFLVAAYKRMLQWWSILNWRKTGKIKYPSKKVAQKILEQNIFGVDVAETAVLVSVFGLTTAFLDKLTPKEIWDNLKFSELKGANIQVLNFSDWAKIAKNEEEKFDLVIGNPPFNSSSLGTITNEDLKELCGTEVPGNKLVLKFFEISLYFGKKVCMILQANPFLYRAKSQAYRNRIFTDYTVEKIYDLTHLRETLFIKKNAKRFGVGKTTGRTPIISLIVNNRKSKFQPIEHVVIKREMFSEKKVRFEIDYYDRHQVQWDWATNEKMQFVWKTNLLGGGQLFHFIYRLSLLNTLKDFLSEKEIKNNWIYNLGYIVKRKNRKEFSADFITGKYTIEPKSFKENGTFKKIIEKSKTFVEIRKKELYENPHIVFKLVVGKSAIPMVFIEEYLSFNSSFVGISAPEKDKKEILNVYSRISKNTITSKLYRAFILCTSAKVGVYHNTSIIKDDIDNLPFPYENEYITPSSTETILINDVLNYYQHLGKAISPKSAGAILHKPATSSDLKAFSNIYCAALNEIYGEENKSWQAGDIIQTSSFISFQFGYGKKGGLIGKTEIGSDKDIMSLLEETNANSGVLHRRTIRTYKHVNGFDCVYLIKPNTKRYWLQSIALRDADDTFMDLKKAGY